MGFALILFTQAADKFEWYLVVFGLFFLIQAVFNFGCGPNGCQIPRNSKNNKTLWYFFEIQNIFLIHLNSDLINQFKTIKKWKK